MFARLRQNTKIILWLVIVSFLGLIFLVWGMNVRRSGGLEAGVVGKIADARITVEEYRNEVANQRAAYYQDKTRRRGAQAEQDINEKAWDAVVQNHLLWKEVAREKLAATDDEVLIEMQANPPPFIRSQPVFQTDSVFDQSKYIAALSDPQYDFRPLEAYIRATLPLQKLQEYLVSGVRVTDGEASLMINMLDEKATISYVAVSPIANVRDVLAEPTESDVSSYYSSHTDEFKVPERRKLRYVQFMKQPSAEDEQYAKDRIQEASDAITAELETSGASDAATQEKAFAEIAMEYSDDEMTGARGGDLGWIKHGQLRGALDSVAFSLDVGKMSDIVRTEGGYHLLIVGEKRATGGAEEIKLRHIMIRLEASPSSIDQIRTEAGDFALVAARKGIEKGSEEQNLKFTDSPELALEQVPAYLRISKEAADAVFKQEKKEVTDALEGAQAFSVIEITDILPERTPPLEEIRDRVKQAYLMNLRKGKASQIAGSIAQDVARGKTLEAAASSWNITVAKSQPFTRTSTVPGIGKDNAVIARAFTLSPGGTSKVIENAGEFFVIRLDNLEAANLERLGGNFGQIRMSLLSTKQQAYINDWYSELLANAKIQDNRSLETGGRATPGGKRPSTGSLYTGY